MSSRTHGKYTQIKRTKLPLSLKGKVDKHCILPVMTYGSETSLINNWKAKLDWRNGPWNE